MMHKPRTNTHRRPVAQVRPTHAPPPPHLVCIININDIYYIAVTTMVPWLCITWRVWTSITQLRCNIITKSFSNQINNLQDGTFLIREKHNAGPDLPFVLSVVKAGKCYHTNIRKTPNGLYLLGKTDKPIEEVRPHTIDVYKWLYCRTSVPSCISSPTTVHIVYTYYHVSTHQWSRARVH
jgi:hypothetical protein